MKESSSPFIFTGITPFPYKVAKALDENIYRNVEFDSWNEERKSSKQRPNYYKVSKMLIRMNAIVDKLAEFPNKQTHAYTQN